VESVQTAKRVGTVEASHESPAENGNPQNKHD